MKVDRKAIIQISILVLLLAGGGGAYLMQQESGLGFITDYIAVFLPGPEKQAAPAPKVAEVPLPKPAEPTIPALPAKGQVRGSAFDPDSVVLEGGMLAFVQSKDPQTVIRLRLLPPKWETPVGKKFKYAPAGASAPIVSIMRSEGGDMKEQTFADKYTLILEFGQEKDKKLSGKVHLALAPDGKTTLAGTFEAEIKGFRIVDGKPDLSVDSTDTLEYLALKALLQDDPDKPISLIAFREERFNMDATEKSRVGYLEVEYRVGQGNPEIKRFQFVKDPEWKLQRTLALNEIDEAHPQVAPGAKDKPERVLAYLAAKQLEAGFKKKSPDKGIYGVSVVTRHNVKNKIGVAEVNYKLDPNGEPLKTAYLFKFKPSGWTFERELKAIEKVNVDSGKIEKKA